LQLRRLLQHGHGFPIVLGHQILGAQVVPQHGVVRPRPSGLLQHLDGAGCVVLVDLHEGEHLVDVRLLGLRGVGVLHHVAQGLDPLVLAQLEVGLGHDEHGRRVALVAVERRLGLGDRAWVILRAIQLPGCLHFRSRDDRGGRLAPFAAASRSRSLARNRGCRCVGHGGRDSRGRQEEAEKRRSQWSWVFDPDAFIFDKGELVRQVLGQVLRAFFT